MLAEFSKALLQAWMAPQASARAILSAPVGTAEVALLVVLGFLLDAAVMLVLPGVRLAPADAPVLRLFLWFAWAVMLFLAVSSSVYFFGKASGGTGTRAQTNAVVAWHSVVTFFVGGPISLFWSGFVFEEKDGAAVLVQSPGSGAILVAVAALAAWCWLLAHFVTVLHGFRNFWGVAAVIMGLPVGLGFLVLNVLGLLATLTTQGLAQ